MLAWSRGKVVREQKQTHRRCQRRLNHSSITVSCVAPMRSHIMQQTPNIGNTRVWLQEKSATNERVEFACHVAGSWEHWRLVAPIKNQRKWRLSVLALYDTATIAARQDLRSRKGLSLFLPTRDFQRPGRLPPACLCEQSICSTVGTACRILFASLSILL